MHTDEIFGDPTHFWIASKNALISLLPHSGSRVLSIGTNQHKRLSYIVARLMEVLSAKAVNGPSRNGVREKDIPISQVPAVVMSDPVGQTLIIAIVNNDWIHPRVDGGLLR